MFKKALMIVAFTISARIVAAQNHKLIIGTYTNKGNSEGIYVYDFNSNNAEIKLRTIIKNVSNPSYLTLSKNNQFLYTIHEDGRNSAASAFKFNAQTGEARFLNREATNGEDPCFVLTDGKNVITANYSGGSISVFGVKTDGSISSIKQKLQHTGKGPDRRQEKAHVHQVLFSPDKKYVISNDLGEDKIYVYHYEADAAQPLKYKTSLKTNPGSGPRHLTFNPNGKFAYLAHEFNGKISVFSYKAGNLNLIQEVETVDKNFKGNVDAADIHISADGKFLYESNRGDANTISVFKIGREGKLTSVETVSSLGKGPRNFSLDPSGKFLLVAHQYTNDVVIFDRNRQTGRLTDSKKRIQVGVPVCLVFSK